MRDTTAKMAARNLGPLPADLINRTLGTELAAGDVIWSKAAQRHLVEDHPEDAEICARTIPAAIAAPTWIGQDPKHPDAFTIVKRVVTPQRDHVLVAVSLVKDSGGCYRVHSTYRLKEDDVMRRREKGRLLVPRA